MPRILFGCEIATGTLKNIAISNTGFDLADQVG
jgi:hypothetical protein